jgi:hypothetical protein
MAFQTFTQPSTNGKKMYVEEITSGWTRTTYIGITEYEKYNRELNAWNTPEDEKIRSIRKIVETGVWTNNTLLDQQYPVDVANNEFLGELSQAIWSERANNAVFTYI